MSGGVQPADQVIETQHDDFVHDCAWDYYGRRLATASSDRTVRVWTVDGDAHALEATLTGHDGPVWEVAWGHPQWGGVLASCGYDGQVIVYREDAGPGRWAVAHQWAPPASAPVSVNGIEFAPHALGALCLAAASSDGHVSVLRQDAETGAWTTLRFMASPLGVNSVSWCPAGHTGATHEDGSLALRLATGSCDRLVKVWRAQKPGPQGDVVWDPEPMADDGKLHTAWVRDVAFAPFYGALNPCLATCSEDMKVYIWTRGAMEPTTPWTSTLMHAFEEPVWRVNWSVAGCILATSSGDKTVTLWKETVHNEWYVLGSKAEPDAPEVGGLPTGVAPPAPPAGAAPPAPPAGVSA